MSLTDARRVIDRVQGASYTEIRFYSSRAPDSAPSPTDVLNAPFDHEGGLEVKLRYRILAGAIMVSTA